MLLAGIDIGSAYSKAVVLDERFTLLKTIAVENKGRISDAVKTLLADLLRGLGEKRLRLGVTGSGRELFSWPTGFYSLNEIIALALGASRAAAGVRSVIEIGAQSSRWLQLGDATEEESLEGDILDFALNEKCAAGAGAFLEQQAVRLKLGIEELSSLAAAARKGAKVAGRCSVFAKSDMIHQQQKGTPVEEIAYGLCLALARNFVATVLKGKPCPPPILLTGGGARNRGLVRAFEEVLELGQGDILVAENPFLTCAFGAARAALRQGRDIEAKALERLKETPLNAERMAAQRLEPLGRLEIADGREPRLTPRQKADVFLGVDVGSVSTNLVIMDSGGRVLAGAYVPTAGRPLEALRSAYGVLVDGLRSKLRVLGIGTTGSGRYLAGKMLHADVIRNEITCQMKSTLHYVPGADTVFEIGGQDSKFISLRDGHIHDFTMNKICAAGTGSFLEEQAALLGISVEGEFSALASRSEAPIDLGSRCTVFMETELTDAVGRGVAVADIAAGLAYSVARNYLEKVVASKTVGSTIVFQGGVASNAAVVKAFSSLLGRDIHVHPYNRISGAIGAALLAGEAPDRPQGRAAGTRDLAKLFQRDFTVSTFECQQCANRCLVNRIGFESENAYFGDTCERYTSMITAGQALSSSAAERNMLPDLFGMREGLIRDFQARSDSAQGTIGLPRVSYILDYLPFWSAFFRNLGSDILLSPETNMAIFQEGLKKLSAEVCLPAKVGFGHCLWLKENGLKSIFFPSVTRFESEGDAATYPCPYGEHLPFMVRSSLDVPILAPTLDLSRGAESLARSLEPVVKALGGGRKDIAAAMNKASAAQAKFQEQLVGLGRTGLAAARAGGVPIFAILGRPYNIYDAFLNLNLARHLKKLGVLALPMDALPIEQTPDEISPNLPVWRYNRLAIRAARWCMGEPDVYPVILTNFGCGPDAFSLKHVMRILGDRPHLVLEFDEHQAEAGLMTRLEAFLDEVQAFRERKAKPAVPRLERPAGEARAVEFYRAKKFFIPYFSDHAHAYAGAMRVAGLDAELLPMPNQESLALGETHSSGKECHAYAFLVGDLLRLARSGRASDAVFFFPGTAHYCLLQQYGTAMNFLLRDLAISGLEVISSPFDFTYKLLAFDGVKHLWHGVVAIDYLIKEACRRRPYEVEPGSTDRVHRLNLKDIEQGLADHALDKILPDCAARLRTIRVRRERRPLVGVAGDVYTRANPIANNDLFHRLEAMGCEVWPPPFLVDEADYSLRASMDQAWRNGRYPQGAAAFLLNVRKDLERMRVLRHFKKGDDRFDEPGYKDVLSYASTYLGGENNPMVLLNVAKMVDYARRGVDGVVNVICFNCMLGTISGALAERIRKDHERLPMPTLVYSGADTASERTRLEAFVYQVNQFAKKRSATRPAASIKNPA